MDLQIDLDHLAEILSHCFQIILSWPCPFCGQPFPCQCDLANMKTAPDATVAGTSGAEKATAIETAAVLIITGEKSIEQ